LTYTRHAVFRDYYACKDCDKKHIPFDKYFDMKNKNYSTELIATIGRLTALTTNFEDIRKIEKKFDLAVYSKTYIMKLANIYGKAGIDNEEELIKKGESEAIKKGKQKNAEVFATLVDGGRSQLWLNPDKMADPDWKEVKLAGFCEYTRTYENNEVKLIKPKWINYYGRVDQTSEEFGNRMYIEALSRGYNNAKEKVFLGDGQKYNWDIWKTHFWDSFPILDWYHATEHLSAASKIIYGEKSDKGVDWYEEIKSILYEGDWEWLLEKIDVHLNKMSEGNKKKALKKERNYFKNNRERILYKKYEEKGYPISSGVIESGIKITVNKRLKGTEKFWRKINANNILKLRLEEVCDEQQNLCQVYKKIA